ncbi:MAG TPA: PAAR domain-containing protein [Pararhizobium sp.]|uniref:PAAR domain-containing protein n=1 Tax=Pararhizobium sp. TaxID=1977563 RepID=UPI002BAB8523|nr:PAAR domain-containing protein [Pararhizobium sp.]HTO33083.1 PAAR domain-containing protein [Pararhizobium sp.]
MSARSVSVSLWILACCVAPVSAQDAWPLPACALSGATSVMIGGQPALRMSDVVNCPPELYEIVPSIFIEGQPIVHFRSGAAAKGDCTAKGEPSVMLEGEAAQRTGDVACTEKSD